MEIMVYQPRLKCIFNYQDNFKVYFYDTLLLLVINLYFNIGNNNNKTDKYSIFAEPNKDLRITGW